MSNVNLKETAPTQFQDSLHYLEIYASLSG